jgi:cytochrome c oxidase subunit 2
MKISRLVGAGAVAIAGAAYSVHAAAADLLGRPTPGAYDMQPGAAPLRDSAIWFHNWLLFPIAAAISIFVLALLVYVVVRFNKRANPVPARWSHNTPVEVAWTITPVLILVVIAVFSFKLLYAYHDMPRPDVTVKVTGYQWYWGYEYPDQKISEMTSVLVPQNKTTPELFRLAADQPLVVPQGKVVRLLVTGADVIHNFNVPSLGFIADAIPGRVNQTWFKAERTGMFYGQCRELCGVDHAFMPINVKVVTQPEFDAWVASKTAKPAAPTPTTNAIQANAAGGSNTPAAAGGAQPTPDANKANPPNKTAAPSAGDQQNPAAGPASNPSALPSGKAAAPAAAHR